MMEMELPGKRKRGRPKRRFLDVVKEDMESWCGGDGRWKEDAVKKHCTLWQTLIKGKSRKKKTKRFLQA